MYMPYLFYCSTQNSKKCLVPEYFRYITLHILFLESITTGAAIVKINNGDLCRCGKNVVFVLF